LKDLLVPTFQRLTIIIFGRKRNKKTKKKQKKKNTGKITSIKSVES